MIINVSSKEDCAICDKFLTLLIQDERKYDSTVDEKFIVQHYFINMLNNQNILLLYEIKNVKVGYIFAKKIDNKYLIDGLYVDQNYRNNKIATELLKEVIKKIYSFGSYQIFINVIKENEIAVNLYKNVGFVIVEENELKYSMVYKEYRLIDASINDIERLKKYKLKTIFEYVKDLELSEKDKINNYVNKTIPNEFCNYKNIVLNDNIVGSVLVTKKDNDILLDEIFIEEQYRNKKIGTSVIKDIIDSVNSSIYLWVYKDNVKAIKLYNKLGFRIKDETDSRYYMEYLKFERENFL